MSARLEMEKVEERERVIDTGFVRNINDIRFIEINCTAKKRLQRHFSQ